MNAATERAIGSPFWSKPMQTTRPLHRGHAALLNLVHEAGERTAYIRGGTVQLEKAPQDFLIGWYEELKGWELIQAEDVMGRTAKIGERVRLTADGQAALERLRQPA